MKTQNTALKIGLACALGALIGTMVSLKINNYFWWVGTLVGFAVGYLSYEFQKLIKAIPIAWKSTTVWLKDTKMVGLSTENSRKVIKLLLVFIGIVLINSIIGWIAFNHTQDINFKPINEPILWVVIFFYVMLGIVSFATMFVFVLALIILLFLGPDNVTLTQKNLIKLIKFSNPVALPILCAYFVCKFVLGFIWDALKFICKFFKNLFLLVHSEARLICGVDAGLGSIIGYFFESPILGVLFGAVFGILNYYVVSIKILKLQPKF